jgi:hypothetical protein
MHMQAVIQIDAPLLLPHLLTRLMAAGLSARPLGLDAGHVVEWRVADPDEALCELRFFLRAWARAHGDVAVRVLVAV